MFSGNSNREQFLVYFTFSQFSKPPPGRTHPLHLLNRPLAAIPLWIRLEQVRADAHGLVRAVIRLHLLLQIDHEGSVLRLDHSSGLPSPALPVPELEGVENEPLRGTAQGESVRAHSCKGLRMCVGKKLREMGNGLVS